MGNLPAFSVCMSVYKNDRPDYFITAVRSIFHQTVVPNEIILVVDGPIPPTIVQAIETLQKEISILSVIWLPENMGHAIARQTGLDAATNELCAIMDSDDISVPDRFEKQLNKIENSPKISIVGGQINEFIDTPDNIVGSRIVPEHDTFIKKYLRRRCPFNQTTVMLRKTEVMNAGGYRDWYCNEDYYLWIRMTEAGCRFANLPDTLVNVRVGEDMYARRGGWRYFKSEAGLQKYMLKHGIISLPRYLFNITARFAFQVAMPNRLRGFVFQKLFRK